MTIYEDDHDCSHSSDIGNKIEPTRKLLIKIPIAVTTVNESVIDLNAPPDIPNSIVQFGGQTAINLSQSLESAGLGILGSTARSIDVASDRHLFEEFLKTQ